MTRLAISTIAWPVHAHQAIVSGLAAVGATAIEIAPTQRWHDLTAATPQEIADYRAEWADLHGLPIVALQALLFGRGDLQIFGSPQVRRATTDYLTAAIQLGGALGAAALVFGSPRNRRTLDRPPGEIADLAAQTFTQWGSLAAAAGTWLCIEANPPDYGADYITTTAQALALVQSINTTGFGLHLDTAALTMADEIGPDAVTLSGLLDQAGPWLRHVHVSEPFLAPVGDPHSRVPHALIAKALRRANYAGAVSIEMAAPRPEDSPDTATLADIAQRRVARALAFTAGTYGPLLG